MKGNVMSENDKPRMLVAEDASGVLSKLKDLFTAKFDVVAAATGRDVLAVMKQRAPFVVALMDIVMPVEDEARNLADAGSTGLRLMERMIAEGVCSRFVVVSVRWDLEEQIRGLEKRGAVIEFLVKQQITGSDEIEEAVNRVVAASRSGD